MDRVVARRRAGRRTGALGRDGAGPQNEVVARRSCRSMHMTAATAGALADWLAVER